jgi:hypothetical protein
VFETDVSEDALTLQYSANSTVGTSELNFNDWKMVKIVFFGRSDEDEDDLRDPIPKSTSKIWTSATRRNISHVNCMSASRVFLF